MDLTTGSCLVGHSLYFSGTLLISSSTPSSRGDAHNSSEQGRNRFLLLHPVAHLLFPGPGEQNDYNDLYWTTGDGGPAEDSFNAAQDLSNLLGAMIRISVPSFDGAAAPYEIPSGNYQGGGGGGAL